MERVIQVKNKAVLLLISAILVLCVGFVIVGCGSGIGPQGKVLNPAAGHYAIDFSDCPDSGSLCWVIIDSESFAGSGKQIEGRELTLEAWIKPHASSTASIFGRMDSAGAALYLHPTGTPQTTRPKFVIRRIAINPITSATSTVEHFVDSGVNIGDFFGQWTHIAGILTSTAHNHTSSATCTNTVMNESPHMDIYVNGDFKNCATTWGNTPYNSAAVPSDDATRPSFAHEPGSHTMAVGIFGEGGAPIEGSLGALPFNGIIDEVRLWAVDRTDLLQTCMNQELSLSGGPCKFTNESEVIGYFRFDEGVGSGAGDWSGLGGGVKERPNIVSDPEHPTLEWSTGWTTDVPSLTRANWF